MEKRNVFCEVGTQFLDTGSMKFVPEVVQMIQNVAKPAIFSGQTWWADLTFKECSLLISGPSAVLLVKLPQCLTLFNSNRRNAVCTV